MSKTVLQIESVSKQYRLGQIGSGTIYQDINRWWYSIRGLGDPYLMIGEINERSVASRNQFVWALKDINFSVEEGEILGIIGRNGAGKSTLLKILSQVTRPTTGQVKVKGRIASLLEVGTGFHPDLTGRENVYLNGAILGMTRSEIRNKFEEIVEFAGVARYIDTPTKRYSSGMKVRLGFAIAAHLEPEILVVDEVLAVGDQEFQRKAVGKMQDVSSSGGRTVLFVSHNMESIVNLCSKSVLLKHGMVDSIGESKDIVEKYSSDNISQALDPSSFQLNQSLTGFGLRSLHMGNDLDNMNNNVKTGADIYFQASFSVNGNTPKYIYPVLVINDKYNQRITALSSLLLKQKFEVPSDEFKITWKLEGCNLAAGNYLIDLFIVDSISSSQKLFEINSAASLVLTDVDFYGTGITNAKRDKVYFPFSVSVESSEYLG